MAHTTAPITMERLRAAPFTFSHELRDMQQETPVWRVITPAGDEAWLVVGAPEIKALLVDERLGRTHPDPAHAAQYVRNAVFDLMRAQTERADGRPWHTWARQMMVPYFTRRRAESMRPRISSLVHAAIDRVLTLEQPVDLQAELSRPVSLSVLYDLIGIPEDERAECSRLIGEMTMLAELPADQSRDTLLGYLRELAPRCRADPGDDLISGVAAQATDEETADVVCMVLFAGGDSVAVHIGYGVALLAGDPALAADLRADPPRTGAAVEEVLRTASHGGAAHPHYANQDIEIGGVHIREGDLVLLDFSWANFDERTFDAPEHVELDRAPNPHLAFGHGAWHCLGAPLARLQLHEVFAALVERMPGLRLTVPVHELASLSSPARLSAGSHQMLPVTW
jgi:cytochrome P450 monooxygenase